MMATSDERFAADSGVAHPVHDMIQSGTAFVLREQHTFVKHATVTDRDC